MPWWVLAGEILGGKMGPDYARRDVLQRPIFNLREAMV